jgi:hypothetical protein
LTLEAAAWTSTVQNLVNAFLKPGQLSSAAAASIAAASIGEILRIVA